MVFAFLHRFSGRELVIPFTNDQLEDDIDGGYTREVVQRILAAKDEGLVSDKAFHELRMALPENVRSYLPPLSMILEERGGTRIRKLK